jgi:hypothetical protein
MTLSGWLIAAMSVLVQQGSSIGRHRDGRPRRLLRRCWLDRAAEVRLGAWEPEQDLPACLGKVGARDKTSGTPVTTFKRSTKLYNLAMSYN